MKLKKFATSGGKRNSGLIYVNLLSCMQLHYSNYKQVFKETFIKLTPPKGGVKIKLR